MSVGAGLSLKTGLQDAFWRLGGVTAQVQTDHSSTATHQLKRGAAARGFNTEYLTLCNIWAPRRTRSIPAGRMKTARWKRRTASQTPPAQSPHFARLGGLRFAGSLRRLRRPDLHRRQPAARRPRERRVAPPAALAGPPLPRRRRAYRARVELRHRAGEKLRLLRAVPLDQRAPARPRERDDREFPSRQRRGRALSPRARATSPHRLPARHRFARAQTRRLRPVSLPRGDVSPARLPAGLRPTRRARRPHKSTGTTSTS